MNNVISSVICLITYFTSLYDDFLCLTVAMAQWINESMNAIAKKII